MKTVTNRDCFLINDHFMKTCLDEATGEMFKLLSSLYEQVVSFWNLDWNAFAGVASPDVQPWIAGSSVDGQKIEI